ncbi:MAG: hypothetical protein WC002_03420 [Candidatus Muiribacteriota bacterium]
MKKLFFITLILSFVLISHSAEINSIFELWDMTQEYLTFEFTKANDPERKAIGDILELGRERWGYEVDFEKNTVMVFDNLNLMFPVDVICNTKFLSEDRNFFQLVSEFYTDRITFEENMELLNLKINYIEFFSENINGFTGFDTITTMKINFGAFLRNNEYKYFSLENLEYFEPVE